MAAATIGARRRSWLAGRLVVAAAAFLVLTGCGSAVESSGGADPTNDQAGHAASSPTSVVSRSPTDASAADSQPGTGEQSPGEGSDGDGTSTSGTVEGSSEDSASPTATEAPETPPPADFNHENSIPVVANVTPNCVVRGTQATLDVETRPDAALAWHARYAGNEGGAEPPVGKGHGGNDKGRTDDDGRYSSTWLVSPDAPVGPARVDVVVGRDGQWGYDDPTFRVGRDPADCEG